jgi:hypothetical protein
VPVVANIVYERNAGFGFPLPDGHELELLEGGLVRLDAPDRGGLYRLDRLDVSREGLERRVHVGLQEQGWWTGAGPGVPAAYPFPTTPQSG